MSRKNYVAAKWRQGSSGSKTESPAPPKGAHPGISEDNAATTSQSRSIHIISSIIGNAGPKPFRPLRRTNDSLPHIRNLAPVLCSLHLTGPLGRTFQSIVIGLVTTSKQLDLTAADASKEAERLDKLEAPAKELAQQLKQDEERRAAQEKARLISKPKFRP